MMQYDPAMKNHPLTEAARYNDAIAEEHGFADAIEKLGMDFEPLVYVTHQRALRAVLLMTRGAEYLKEAYGSGDLPFVLPLSDTEREYAKQLQAVLMDGVMIGWRAAQASE